MPPTSPSSRSSAFRGLAAFRGTATVRSWLYRIAINCALSWLREQPAEIGEDALTDDNPAPARLSTSDDCARLRAAIDQMLDQMLGDLRSAAAAVARAPDEPDEPDAANAPGDEIGLLPAAGMAWGSTTSMTHGVDRRPR